MNDEPRSYQHLEWRARDCVILAIEGMEASPADPPIAMAKSVTLAQRIVELQNAELKRRDNG